MVDHPRRDLAGIVLTALALCQRGITCHLVPLNLRDTEVFALRPDHVLLNFARRGSEDFAQGLVEAGIGISVLETEGVVWTNDDEYAEMFWPNPDLRARIETACMWGPRLADELVRRGIYAAAQARVTGCPRFDFYHPSLLPALAPEPAVGRTGHTILVNTNFSLTNSRFVPLAENLASLRVSMRMTEAESRRWASVEQAALSATIAMVRALSLDFPAASIVVRPHPFEEGATYRHALDGAPNVRVDGTGPVLPQLIGSDVLIQRSCTTGIEAAMLGMPTLSPLWIIPPYVFQVAEALSAGCESYPVLRDQVAAVLQGRYEPPGAIGAAREGIIPQIFHSMDGLAHERVAGEVARVATRRRVRADVCDRYLYGLADRNLGLVARASRRARLVFRLNPAWSYRRMRVVPEAAWTGSDKAFSVGDVRTLVAGISDCRSGGDIASDVTVDASAARGETAHGFPGHSVTMAPT